MKTLDEAILDETKNLIKSCIELIDELEGQDMYSNEHMDLIESTYNQLYEAKTYLRELTKNC